MISRQPLRHVRRQQELLITHHRTIRTRHTPLFRVHQPHPRTPTGDFATATKDDAKTAAATHPDHPTWTTTGDIGHVDADGYLYLTDRAAFTIISGGVNVYPQEIEDALALHPAILDVAVVGVPDDDLGQVPLAVVQPADGVEPTPALAEEILADLDGRLARFKMPRALHFVDALPRSATGKLVKKDLAARFA